MLYLVSHKNNWLDLSVHSSISKSDSTGLIILIGVTVSSAILSKSVAESSVI